MKWISSRAHAMNQPIVIIGIGQLGGVFARAFLRKGHPVYPVTRGMNIVDQAEKLPHPEMVLVAVAEKDFQAVMATIPAAWRNRIALLQNELLPRDWEDYDISSPTVISVWFEKKQGREYKVLIPSRVQGPKAALIAGSLEDIGIPCKILSGARELLYELVLKNVFVFTINIAGLVLEEGTTTEALWTQHNELARAIADEVIDVQEWLTEVTFRRKRLIDGTVEGIYGDPTHKCKGRSAQGRLTRVIETAEKAGLKIPRIREIREQLK
jgi:ketopantoate reductase